MEKEGKLPDSSYKGSIILIPKLDKGHNKKRTQMQKFIIK
jgi:hypothetical protein